MHYTDVVALLELIIALLTPVVLLLLMTVVLMLVVPRIVAVIADHIVASPTTQRGLILIVNGVRDGTRGLMWAVMTILMSVLHWLITLYTAQPLLRNNARYVEQTRVSDAPSVSSPDGADGALQRQTEHRQTEIADIERPLIHDIIERVQHERTRESVMYFLLACGWTTEQIRSVVKGDTTALTKQIAELRVVLYRAAEARRETARQQLEQVRLRQQQQEDDRGEDTTN